MTKTVLVLAALAAIGFSGAALATTSTTTTKASFAMSGSEIVVAQNVDNQGVRDWGQGSGRDEAGQGKGQGKKGQ